MPKPSFNSDDFTGALLGLLPRGRVWPKDLGSVHAKAVSCFAPSFQRISDTAADLIADAFPGSTNDLLTEWELTLGLPDACTVPGSQTFAERQKAVTDKISAAGGPQRAYYIQMAEQLGVSVTIDEYQFVTVDNARTGDFLYGDGWPWGWLACAPSALYGSANAAMLNCRIQQEKPEYTDVVLGFGREIVDNIISQVDSLFYAIHYVTPAAIAGIEDF